MNHLYSAEYIKKWDEFTIKNEPIASIDLMERAALACSKWIEKKYPKTQVFDIFCGPGNNGGDGLAIARILYEKNYTVNVYLLDDAKSNDCKTNLKVLPEEIPITYVKSINQLKTVKIKGVIIDALFGTGLSRSLKGLPAALVIKLNEQEKSIISIDIASGLSSDKAVLWKHIIKPKYTLSFEIPKAIQLMPQAHPYTGELIILRIGLHEGFHDSLNLDKKFIALLDEKYAHKVIKPRATFGHKGTFGHALIVAGSQGKIGAAILCGKAALKTGCGLLTIHLPESGVTSVHSVLPEAMVTNQEIEKKRSEIQNLQNFNAIGIGPGIGTSNKVMKMLKYFLKEANKPIVLDADAINLLSKHKTLIKKIPKGSILTPHPKEFQRLLGATKNDAEIWSVMREFCLKNEVNLLVKGAYSKVCDNQGNLFINISGNEGMATAGSGDVLTGMITSLLAQGYAPSEALKLGVYLHGTAGDCAIQYVSKQSLIASDIIDNISKAYKKFEG